MNSLPKRKRTSPFSVADAYKLSHHKQYPDGITWVYSNFTPRKSRTGFDEFVFFGLQAVLYKINERFQRDFFDIPEDTAVNDFKTFYYWFFGAHDEELYEKIRYVHQLGYLPLQIVALPEGTVVKHGIPCFTICNTDPKCYWLTNWIETWISCELWKSCTAATTSMHYRRCFDHYANLTSDLGFMPAFQGHGFEMRGMSGIEDAMAVAAGNALSTNGEDSGVTFEFVDDYYWGSPDDELIITSVPATEHSVMSAGGKESEIETFRRLLKTYPTGILSVVSDTWDFWKVVTEILPALKDEIMARDGKLVIRPDSSPKTPVEMIVGDHFAEPETPEWKGLILCLYEIFGGTENSKGFIELDSHIGAIYGDSITLDYQQKILQSLKEMGFSSTNIVLGIGSYTFQYVTRDTHGIAIKATAVGTGWKDDGFGPTTVIPIFKDPKTDNSGKKSAKGLLDVKKVDGDYVLFQYEDDSDANLDGSAMKVVYQDGVMLKHQSFSEIRKTLKEHTNAN